MSLIKQLLVLKTIYVFTGNTKFVKGIGIVKRKNTGGPD